MLLYIKVGHFLAIKESDIQKSQTDTNVAQSGQNVITAADVSGITATIGKLTEEFNQTRKQVEEMSKFIQRGHEAGIMNDTTHSSVVVRHTGQINLSASMYSSRKLNPNGKTIESTMESVALSNRSKLSVNDVVINEHKLNPYLYELTDMKKISITQNNNLAVGNFCAMGTVLTRAWERNLKRYTLLRRPFRGPLFSHVLNIPEINNGLGITDPLKIDEELVAKSPKGYQVNAVVSDSESLINKPGVDPNVGSIKRDTHIIISSTAEASSGGSSGGNVPTTATTTTPTTTSTTPVDVAPATPVSAEDLKKGVTVIGDSIANGSRSIIKKKFSDAGIPIIINARGSRSISSDGGPNMPGESGSGYEAALSLKNNNQLCQTVVVELGTNGGLSKDFGGRDLDKFLEVLGTERNIYWVTIYNHQYLTQTRERNNDIKNLQNTKYKIKIIDWYSVVSQHHQEYLGDGICHPNLTGGQALADLIFAVVTGKSR